jgi:hypothetical protein
VENNACRSARVVGLIPEWPKALIISGDVSIGVITRRTTIPTGSRIAGGLGKAFAAIANFKPPGSRRDPDLIGIALAAARHIYWA